MICSPARPLPSCHFPLPMMRTHVIQNLQNAKENRHDFLRGSSAPALSYFASPNRGGQGRIPVPERAKRDSLRDRAGRGRGRPDSLTTHNDDQLALGDWNEHRRAKPRPSLVFRSQKVSGISPLTLLRISLSWPARYRAGGLRKGVGGRRDGLTAHDAPDCDGHSHPPRVCPHRNAVSPVFQSHLAQVSWPKSWAITLYFICLGCGKRPSCGLTRSVHFSPPCPGQSGHAPEKGALHYWRPWSAPRAPLSLQDFSRHARRAQAESIGSVMPSKNNEPVRRTTVPRPPKDAWPDLLRGKEQSGLSKTRHCL
jgi:hypothetical protein